MTPFTMSAIDILNMAEDDDNEFSPEQLDEDMYIPNFDIETDACGNCFSDADPGL